MSNDELYHYGTPHDGSLPHSGRYEYGSGDNPGQHGSKDFLMRVKELKANGMTEKEIADGYGISIAELRSRVSVSNDEVKLYQQKQALQLHEHGYSNVKIGEMLGVTEGTVRNYLKDDIEAKATKTQNTADAIKTHVDSKRYVDIGTGVELDLGVSETRMKTAINSLKEEGYKVLYLKVPQMGTNHFTNMKVLVAPDVTYPELLANKDKIANIQEYSGDDGKTWSNILPPKSLSSSRVMIRYNEEGGIDRDGTIEIRRGVEDISLGKATYAQVRIAVDGTHYLKGMAVYSDNMPDGVDVIFNTNKHTGTPKEKVFKPLKEDPNNPFGATIKKQLMYTDAKGKEQLSVVNIVNEEGDWGNWSKTLSSQFLGKQSLTLIKRQLDLSYSNKKAEYDEIMSLTNPEVKKKLLESFADDCDASAVHLKAASLPRQASHVILPIPTLKDGEIYAPNYKNGEQVALVRHPHEGTFQIPILTVNNNNKLGKSMITSTALDAVGINSKAAERLSGADFDGDSVLVIPVNNRVRITSTPLMSGLIGYDPKDSYKKLPGDNSPAITNAHKQKLMGEASNLITDMTLKGADPNEITRAVKFSMCVIDSEKHNLDYKRCEKENGIRQLKLKYQGEVNPETGKISTGAATLLSRSKSEQRVLERRELVKTDEKTGEKIFFETGRTYTTKRTLKDGTEVKETHVATEKSTKMAETKDAYTLSSGTKKESYYAEYANSLKALGNTARLSILSTPSSTYSSEANKKYKAEVDSLNDQLTKALQNAPRERKAQLMANVQLEAAKADNPDMTKDDIKKKKTQLLAGARTKYGAKKEQIVITDREWEAIQAHALSSTAVSKILNNTDLDDVKKRAMPKASSELSSSKQAQIKAYQAAGYTTKEIADELGVSTSTVSKYIKPKE